VDGLHAHGSQTTERHDDDPSTRWPRKLAISAGEAIGSRYEHPGYTLAADLLVVDILWPVRSGFEEEGNESRAMSNRENKEKYQ
jgi:hypothetical protein